MKTLLRIGVALAALQALAGTANAALWTFDIYYTKYDGGVNVRSQHFDYDDSTMTLSVGANTAIAALPGADGIIFSPTGNLLIGGQCSGMVYEITTAGAPVGSKPTGGCVYHETLDPSGTKVYTSDFGGALKTLPYSGTISGGGPTTTTPITGSETGITSLAFDTDAGGVWYVNGSPNGMGEVGEITLGTGVTVRHLTDVISAHGMIYDPYTDKMTLFGAGAVGTFSTSDAAGTLSQRTGITCDFDQGAVDGKGHAFIAGCGAITFIDYRASGDITLGSNFTVVTNGFGNIDDVAPLTGAGSQNFGAPAPGALALLGLGLLGIVGVRRRLN